MTIRRLWERLVKNEDWVRHQWWPVRLRWGWDAGAFELLGWRYHLRHWFAWHGIEVAPDRVPHWRRSFGKMPGFRTVVMQVYHFGPLRLVLGRNTGEHPTSAEVDVQARAEEVSTAGLFRTARPSPPRDMAN